MRIVSLLPSVTEICFTLGLSDRVVGVTHECDYPPAAQHKPHVTRSLLPPDITDGVEVNHFILVRSRRGNPLCELDFDTLAELKPDLIFTQQLCDPCTVSYADVLAAVRRLPKPLRVVSIDPQTLDEALEVVREIGDLTGRRSSERFASECTTSMSMSTAWPSRAGLCAWMGWTRRWLPGTGFRRWSRSPEGRICSAVPVSRHSR